MPIRILQKKEILQKITAFGEFSLQVEEALKLPDKLYFDSNPPFERYSSSSNFEIDDIYRALKLKQKPEIPKDYYGFSFRSNSDSIDFCFVDYSRKIAFIERLMNVANNEPKFYWNIILNKILSKKNNFNL